MTDQAVIGPGATLGVFGGGQLGRMFAMAAARLGYRTHVFEPERDCPAAHIAHRHTSAACADEHAVGRFARNCDVVTLEFENVPAGCLQIAAAHTIVRPDARMLAIAQDRLTERRFLDGLGLPTAPHAAVADAAHAIEAAEKVGTPGVLKAAHGGYDGRGQVRVDDPADSRHAWRRLGTDRALYEAWVDFEMEVSVLIARSPRGELRTFGPIENRHHRHVLDRSIVPARVSATVADLARDLACHIAASTALEGLLCVEMFLLRSGDLLINELAPRPHNSGHLTIEACAVSQFEQHVRAICNLPLADMTLRGGAAMANLLAELWAGGEPDWPGLIAQHPDVALHLYGKTGTRPGRKMGHLTAVADSAAHAAIAVDRARSRLTPATRTCA